MSDFFYPWTKKLLANDFPGWFDASTTPKKQELIVDRKHKLAPSPKSGKFFAEKMSACLQEARTKLTDQGAIVLMYGHKELGAWTALFEAIKNAGLRVTVSWPIHTERKSKFRHSRVDALSSSCVLVMRPTNASNDLDSFIDAVQFKATAAMRMNELKTRHPELEKDPVALSMSVFPLVLDDYMHTAVVAENGTRVAIQDLMDSINL